MIDCINALIPVDNLIQEGSCTQTRYDLAKARGKGDTPDGHSVFATGHLGGEFV